MLMLICNPVYISFSLIYVKYIGLFMLMCMMFSHLFVQFSAREWYEK
jgi:hypothetical protein